MITLNNVISNNFITRRKKFFEDAEEKTDGATFYSRNLHTLAKVRSFIHAYIHTRTDSCFIIVFIVLFDFIIIFFLNKHYWTMRTD